MNAKEFLQKAKKEISSDPLDRLHPAMRKALKDKKAVFDMHAHAFNWKDIPTGYAQLRIYNDLGIVGRVYSFWKGEGNNLPGIIKGGKRRMTERLKNSRESMINNLAGVYSKSGHHPVFSVLQMDMRAIQGNTQQDFTAYTQSQIALKNKYPDQVLLFYPCDPANPNLYREFLQHFGKSGEYYGIKIYPSLGYLPSHPDLLPIYEICEEKNIPVTSHCSSATTRSSDRDIEIKGLDNVNFKPFSKMTHFTASAGMYRKIFNGPENWLPVLHHFPGLRLNIAHMGGTTELTEYLKRIDIAAGDPSKRSAINHWLKENSWTARILQLLSKYDHVYADISYMIFQKNLHSKVFRVLNDNPAVQQKFLYGSDFPLSETGSEFEHQWDKLLSAYGSTPVWKNITTKNPAKFLNIDA